MVTFIYVSNINFAHFLCLPILHYLPFTSYLICSPLSSLANNTCCKAPLFCGFLWPLVSSSVLDSHFLISSLIKFLFLGQEVIVVTL
jgi:hypothetical protein